MKTRTMIRNRAKSAAETTLNLDHGHDSTIIPRHLHADAESHVSPWLVQVADGFCYGFDTESDAKCFQRDYIKLLAVA